MATPKEGYYVDGKRVPGVTTILGRFKESGGLLYWANQQGRDGKTLDEARAEVTTPGTLAHKAVEDHINGRPETALTGAGEVTEKARNAYAAYLHWEAINRTQQCRGSPSETWY